MEQALIRHTQDRLANLLVSIDQGIQAHLAWNQRLIRCAVLRQSPGEEMLLPDAHCRCQLGLWLLSEKSTLKDFDAALVDTLDAQHRTMHDAVRNLCQQALSGQAAREEDFLAYERNQSGMIHSLHTLRLRVADSVLQDDALTGLPLRNGFEDVFRIRQHDAEREGRILYLALLDVDYFKRINDTWGHTVGDRALQHVSGVLRDCLRENDIVIRYGGEEFLLLLLGQDVQGITRRILDALRTTPLLLDDGGMHTMTATIGVTLVRSGESMEAVIDRADIALLQGKRDGRDRCVVRDPLDR